MRKTISVAALLLALTCPTYAGEMQNDSPKPQVNGVQTPTVDGEIPNVTPDRLAEIALDLLAVLPSLF